MPSQNHYLKRYVGDEARIFMGVSCEAEGLWSKLSRIAHDREPYGFLVDAYQRPLPDKHLADMCYLTNGRFEAILAELRKHGAIQSIGEFELVLRSRGDGRPLVRRRLEVYGEMRASVKESDVEVLLVPPLVQQHIDALVGKRTGGTGGNPDLKVVNHPLNHLPDREGLTTGLTTPDNAQNSKVKGQRSKVKGQVLKGKNATAASARALEEMQQAPWSWPQHKFYCDEIRRWEATLPKDVLEDEIRYETHFFGKFKIMYDVFRAASRFYEFGPQSPEIPQPCRDGHHVREENGQRCKYCREFIAEGATA